MHEVHWKVGTKMEYFDGNDWKICVNTQNNSSQLIKVYFL